LALAASQTQAAQEQRGRNGSPLPWLVPLAKKLRKSTSFGKLCGGKPATNSPPPA